LEKSQFKDVWDRYLNNFLENPLKKDVTNVTTLQANGYKASLLRLDNSQSVTEKAQSVTNTPCYVTENQNVTDKAIQNKACYVSTSKMGGSSEVFLSDSEIPSKSELDASWDTYINEPEAEKSAVRTGF
jgi:hypothetical protein